MKILVSGATGLVGTAVTRRAENDGHSVAALTRNPRRANDIRWTPANAQIDAASLEGFNAVVHLAGDNIAEGRWNDAKKQRIRDSRVAGTELLSRTLASLANKPSVLVAASAIGYYGSRGDELLDENSSPGNDFLAEVCRDWEAATQAARDAGIRVVNLRIGVVLSTHGGALKKMLTPFKLGLGGPIGNGRQFVSWISLTDLSRVIMFCINHDKLSGPVNAVAPGTCTNADYTRYLAKAISRPAFMPLPAFAARLALGETADALLLSSTRVAPVRVQQAGFHFEHAHLDESFREILKQ